MEKKRFLPQIDRLFWIILSISAAVMIPLTCLMFFPPFNALVFFTILASDLLVAFFIISPLFGYVELRESTVFIKFGIFLTREIPYAKIRELKTGRAFYSESIISLKNALDHVNIRYNSFDVVTVSVKNNDEFIEAVNKKMNS